MRKKLFQEDSIYFRADYDELAREAYAFSEAKIINFILKNNCSSEDANTIKQLKKSNPIFLEIFRDYQYYINTFSIVSHHDFLKRMHSKMHSIAFGLDSAINEDTELSTFFKRTVPQPMPILSSKRRTAILKEGKFSYIDGQEQNTSGQTPIIPDNEKSSLDQASPSDNQARLTD